MKNLSDQPCLIARSLAVVGDAWSVLIMRDAAAYQELKDRSAAVTKKVQAAPKLPAARKSEPAADQRNQKLEKKFRTGNAGLKDLARFV